MGVEPARRTTGLIALPAPKWRQNRPKPIVFGPETEPPLFPAPASLDEVRPLDLRTVARGTQEGKLAGPRSDRLTDVRPLHTLAAVAGSGCAPPPSPGRPASQANVSFPSIG